MGVNLLAVDPAHEVVEYGRNLRWSLDADHAEVYDKRQETLMRRVAIRVFSKDADWTVTAAEGVLNNDSRDVALRGDVVVTSRDGLRMTTQSLRWRNQERALDTTDPVEITRAGTTEAGKLRDAIAATKDYDGVTGKITIDAQRNAQKDAVVLKIKDGKFKFYRSVPAA